MKHYLHALMLLGVGAALTGCSDDNPWAGETGRGGIRLNLTTSSEVIDAKPQVRSGAETLEAPAPEDFNVKLEKTDGSSARTWSSLTAFNNENNFETGSYVLTAFYGNPEEEGFDLPYFEGSTNLSVLEARETEASVTASLANCMVSIDYTDAFKAYFSDYATTVHSEGHSYVKFAKEETRPAYINPGEVDLAVEITRPSGQSATVQPASFAAEAKHHYHITFDVNNGEVGEAQLTIVFDDSLVQEDVVIDLTDELFSSPAPSINPSGFTNGQQLELLSQTASSTPLKFTVIARGQLSECNLTIASADYTPAFGKEINLLAATDAQQAQIADAGITVLGLYKNPDRMASVDITGLTRTLPAGEYEISLQAKDKFTRVSEPVSVHLTCVPLELSVEPQTGVFGVPTAVVKVGYNGADPLNDITFQAFDQYGAWKQCPVQSVTESTRSRSIETKYYLYTITLPDTERAKVPLRVYLKGTLAKETEILVDQPEYTLQADAFSTYAVLKVNSDDSSVIPTIAKALRVFVNGEPKTGNSLGYNSEAGMVIVKGLTPATSYEVVTSLTNTINETAKSLNITTEAGTALTNGNFADTHETINIPSIQTGGSYAGTVGITRTYSIRSSILRSEATGWASINQKTCYTGSNPMNTWFCAPSTWVENGEVTVRSVGFNHAGTLPGRYDKTGVYYNINAPSFGDANKAAGELFLGSYTFDGSESRTDGIAFGCRPTSLSFSYTYSPVNGESGVAYVAVLDEAGKVIASGRADLSEASSATAKTVVLSSYTFGSKAAKVQVRFLSSNATVPAINIPTGSALNEGLTVGNFTNPPAVATNRYKAVATGSVLKLSNVKLNY